MKLIVPALGLAALLLWGVQARAEEKKREAPSGIPRLTGTYVIVSGEKFGQTEPTERIKGIQVRFTEDVVTVTDREKKETFAATYKLDWSRRPYAITMTSTRAPNKGEVARGLLDKEGDTIRLIYALPGGAMPTGFKKTKDKQLLFVMKALSH